MLTKNLIFFKQINIQTEVGYNKETMSDTNTTVQAQSVLSTEVVGIEQKCPKCLKKISFYWRIPGITTF